VRILFFYRLIQLFSVPFLVVYFAMRILADRAYMAHFGERLGFLPRRFKRTAPGAIWLHAVSAGEIGTAVPLIRELRRQQPRTSIFVSTSTLAGRAAGMKRLDGLAEGVFFCPLDFASCVRRVLGAIKPSLVMILETEIWPNLYAEVKRTGASLAIINARISNKSWPHYRSMKMFFAPVLRLADVVFPQSATDRDRYYRLGVPLSRLRLEGNLKYDGSGSANPASIPTFGADPVWIAASTVAPGESRKYKHKIDEDDIVLDAFEKLREEFPRLLLILAPRQPARFEPVSRKLAQRRINFVRRTELKRYTGEDVRLPGVLLLDTIGELADIFSLADVVFVGGSIAPRGGHNLLEPAASGAAIVSGVHMENFEAIARDFIDAGAIVQVSSAAKLAPTVADLLRDREKAHSLGRRARVLVQQKQGTAERISRQIWALYWSATPRNPHGLFAKLILAPLSKLWIWGGYLKRRNDEAHQQRLPYPVISVGGITVGGAGKTPFTNYLAGELSARGYRPAILTRGYRRRTPARHVILPAGIEVSPALTGDEAQIFLRSGICPVGIGADRLETGRLLLQRENVNIFVLDDGYQHRRIFRDVDIVLIDGLMPFGYQHTIPLGSLREPLSFLNRAHVLVVTRAENDVRYEVLTKQLRKCNAHAPIFRVFTRPRKWRMCQQRTTLDQLPSRRVAAFCALGNPQSFWNTLMEMGFETVYRWSFPDHHVYQPHELKRLSLQAQSAGASVLVTTEKDRINFPPDFEMAVAPLEVAWLEIDNVLEKEGEFFEWLEQRLPARQRIA
jgi:tetraacyldisaccharide 4'-kinase